MNQNNKAPEPATTPPQPHVVAAQTTPPASEEWKEQTEPIKNNDQDAGREHRTGNHHSPDAK